VNNPAPFTAHSFGQSFDYHCRMPVLDSLSSAAYGPEAAATSAALPGTAELGGLGIRHLKRFWARTIANREGRGTAGDPPAEWVADNTLLAGLRVGLRETYSFIFETLPPLERFEAWVLERNGGAIDPARIAYLNSALSGEAGIADAPVRSLAPDRDALPFTVEDMAFWEENGYVVLHDAVPPENCEAAARAIYDFIGMDLQQPETWYRGPQTGIWVPLIHHPALWANRDSPRIFQAFRQLWNRRDLWVSVDQAGMNPPERPGWQFPGPNLHFDVSLQLPIPFGVQGILYLTDTAADQGAFRCVPGFHRRIEAWLNSLPPGTDPRAQDLTKFESFPIAGRAGDLVIWHQALPHGASPNRSARPRVVQYIKMHPSQWDYNAEWR
jgi:hypothetical protein